MATVIGIVGKLELNIYLLTKLGLNGYLLTHDGPDHYPTIIAPTELSYPETFTGAEEFVEMDELSKDIGMLEGFIGRATGVKK